MVRIRFEALDIVGDVNEYAGSIEASEKVLGHFKNRSKPWIKGGHIAEDRKTKGSEAEDRKYKV